LLPEFLRGELPRFCLGGDGCRSLLKACTEDSEILDAAVMNETKLGAF